MKKNNQKNIPRLRFPEFNGEWEEKRLGNIVSFLKGRGISKKDIFKNGKNKCILYGELYTKYNEIIENIFSSTNIDKTDSFVSKKDDLLFPSSGETPIDIAKVSYLKEGGVLLGGDLNVMRFKKDYEGVFFAYYLSNFKKRDIAKLAQGNSVVHLYSSFLGKIKVNLPKKEEQQKIASFLSVVDQKIEGLKKKKEMMEKYKKGVMQKIFNQEIRFKDENGKDFSAWRKIILNEILKERKTYSTKNNGFKHISLTTEGVVAKSVRYHRDFLVKNDDIKKYKITKRGDLCYNPANLKFGVIAVNDFDDGIFSPIYVTYEILNADSKFVHYYFTRRDFINFARRFEQGTIYERMAVNPMDFIKLKISIPSLKEQQKISLFLSSLDKKIEKINQELTQMQKFKKGLLQGLFV